MVRKYENLDRIGKIPENSSPCSEIRRNYEEALGIELRPITCQDLAKLTER